MKRVWFITGVSSGLGNALAEEVIRLGNSVIATFRSQEQADVFNRQHLSKGCGVCADVTDITSVSKALQSSYDKFGKIDVLVNNAGVGFAGAIEEVNAGEWREVMEVNFFGTLNVTRLALPIFRQQKSGHIIQVSSHGGVKAFAGFGVYNASKFAIEGFSEALAAEIAPFGIKLTLVEPGPMRTNFAGSSLRQAKEIIDDYRETAGLFREKMKAIHGKQEVDPVKAAKAIIQIAESESPPLRLPLGKTAITTITSKLQSVQLDLECYKSLTESVMF